MLGTTDSFLAIKGPWGRIIVVLGVLAGLMVVNVWAEDVRSPSESADLANQVRQLAEKGEFERALEIVESLAQEYSTRSLAGRLLIWVRDIQGQSKLAEEDLKRWQQTYPDDNGMAILLAWYYRQNDQPRRARAILTKAVQKNRRLLAAYRSLANLEADEGRRVEAVRWLAKMVLVKKSAIDEARWRVIDIAGSTSEAVELLNELRREKDLPRNFTLAWAMGTVAERARMSDEAAVYYREAIKLEPRLGHLYAYLIRLQLRQGRADEAMKIIVQAEKAQARGMSFYQLEGLAYLLKDDLESAIVSLEATLGVEPKDTAAREVLASVLLAVGRPDESAKHLESLLGEDPNEQNVSRQLMEAYLADGRFERAGEIGEKVVAEGRLEALTALRAAQVFLAAKKAKRAIEILKSVSVQPEHKGLWQVLWIEALLGGKKKGKARRELAGWLKEMPTVDKRSELAGRMAAVMAQAGEKAMAVKLASRELKKNPDHHLLRETLIHVLVEKEDYKRAKKLIADWSATESKSQVRALRAMVLLAEKNYAEAEQELGTLIRENPKDVQSQYLLGVVYESMGQGERANKQYETVLKIDPSNIWANNNLGYSLAAGNERLEDAQAMISLALRGGPVEVAIVDSMGWVLYKRGRFAQAEVYLSRAVRLVEEPKGELQDHLGDAFYRLKENSKAVEAWQVGLQAELSAKGGDAKMVKSLQNKLQMVESKRRAAVAWSVVDQEQ